MVLSLWASSLSSISLDIMIFTQKFMIRDHVGRAPCTTTLLCNITIIFLFMGHLGGSVKQPTLDFNSGLDLTVMRSSPMLGSVLTGQSLLRILSLLSLCPSPLSPSLSLSQNKNLKKLFFYLFRSNATHIGTIFIVICHPSLEAFYCM